MKAIPIAASKTPLLTHNIQTLLNTLPSTLDVPADVQAAAALTDYAVSVRYPGVHEEIEDEEYEEAVGLAQRTQQWETQTLAQGGFL